MTSSDLQKTSLPPENDTGNHTGSPDQPAGEKNGYPPIPEDALIIIPVRNTVLFPGMVIPVTIVREKSLLAAQAAMRTNRQIGIVLQRDSETANPEQKDLYSIGTRASILRYVAASSELSFRES